MRVLLVGTRNNRWVPAIVACRLLLRVPRTKAQGQLVAQVPAQAAAKSYTHEYTLYPVTAASVWKANPSSRSKSTFNGLEAGKKYAVRVGIVGNNEEVAYSPIATSFVL